MKKHTFLLSFIIAVSLTLAGIPDVEAKRFGGARSFGSKRSYSTPFRRSALPSKSTRSASQQQAYQKNQAARQNMSRRGGLWGMLGALAIGGLLGSMLFGGAFEGLNLMDILIFAGIAFLLYRLFAARKPQPAYQRNSLDDKASDFSNASTFQHDEPKVGRSSSPFNTDVLFGNKQANGAAFDDADFERSAVPEGFDEEDFLTGAKNAFYELQRAWDNRDLTDIRALTTDKVFAEIQAQLQATTEQNQTEVLHLDAELLDVRELNDELEAVVLFDAVIRENPDEQANQIREVWHFVKPKRAIQSKWYLDGIQQLED